MLRLELSLLGPQVVALSGVPAEGFAVQKARALLYYLAIETGQAHPRESLVGLLWPEMPETAARSNLRQALANLREAIGDEQPGLSFLAIRRDSLQANPDNLPATDVATFVALLDACETHTHRRPDRCASCAARRRQAIQLYRGDFLAGFHLRDADPFEEWAAINRERLHRRMSAALVQQATFHEWNGALELALAMVSLQLELDPWMEEAHRERMRLLARLGRRSEALAQFDVCRRVLAEELGVEPAAETIRLYQRITEGSLLEAGGPVPLPYGPLPQPGTPLIGRRQDLAELADWLEDPSHRLVTLVGGSGVGKSRLALAAAERVRTAFSDGVIYLRGSSLDAAAQLPGVILATLPIDPSGLGDPMEVLLRELSGREMLLVIDGVEHLLPAARGLLRSILDAAPRTVILLTSQERIGLQAERCFEVEGLETDSTPEPAGQPAAVELFLERGRRISRRLGTEAPDLEAIRRICRLVEGNPLAIELAASGVDRLTCAQIADGLEADLHSLVTGHHDLPERHRSLAAALDYSWGLLDLEHQRLLRQLSVFHGGWEAEAALQVVGASEASLQLLADRSLVRIDRAGRYGFHPLMEQHALRVLEAAEETVDVRRRHIEYFRAWAELAEPHLLGPQQTDWLPRLDVEVSNLRQALSSAIGAGAGEEAARLCLALARYWMIRGLLAEGQQWIEDVMRLAEPPTPSLRVRLLNRAGVLAAMQRRFDQAEPHLQASVALARELGDRQGEAMSLNSLGAMSIELGRYAAARSYLEACLPAWEQLGNPDGLASTLNNLGAVALLSGDPATARTRFEQSLPLFRQLGDRRMIAGVLYNLGDLSLAGNDLAQARLHLLESLELRSQIGEVGGVAESLEGLARIAVRERQAGHAAMLFGAVSTMRESVGAPPAPVSQADVDQAVEEARRQLGDEAYWAAHAAGCALSLEQAVALAR